MINYLYILNFFFTKTSEFNKNYVKVLFKGYLKSKNLIFYNYLRVFRDFKYGFLKKQYNKNFFLLLLKMYKNFILNYMTRE